jgi:energy-coupling factor transporter ATP-binding protein EcfA2
MADRGAARAVLITGGYGSGKTTIVEELAQIFEERRERYAAIDLDWLAWFDPGVGVDDDDPHAAAIPTMLKNVDCVVANYYATGVRTFALAGAMRSSADVESLQRALAMPLITVRLETTLDEVERRLTPAASAGRGTDLEMARTWAAGGVGAPGDLSIANDGPVRDVAIQVVAAIGW